MFWEYGGDSPRFLVLLSEDLSPKVFPTTKEMSLPRLQILIFSLMNN